jgi:hypothetical protein
MLKISYICSDGFIEVIGVCNAFRSLKQHNQTTKTTDVYKTGANYCFADPGGHAVYDVDPWSLACWDRRFDSRRGHGCLSLMFICCVVLCR